MMPDTDVQPYAADPATPVEVAGTVAWYNPDKAYGFIRREDGSGDVFLHITAIVDRVLLRPGDKVVFQIAQGKKGPAAANVRRS